MTFFFATIVCWGCSRIDKSQTENPEVESGDCTYDHLLDAEVEDLVRIDLDKDGNCDILRIVDGKLVYYRTNDTGRITAAKHSLNSIIGSISIEKTDRVFIWDFDCDNDYDIYLYSDSKNNQRLFSNIAAKPNELDFTNTLNHMHDKGWLMVGRKKISFHATPELAYTLKKKYPTSEIFMLATTRHSVNLERPVMSGYGVCDVHIVPRGELAIRIVMKFVQQIWREEELFLEATSHVPKTSVCGPK